MVKYGNSKIYKLVSDETEKIYIGSTTRQLCKRMSEHRSKFNTKYGCASEEIMKYPDVRIILIENFPCQNREELLSREEYWRQQLKDIVVNKQSAFGMDPTKKYNKWHLKNRDHLLKSKKEYRKKQFNCDYCAISGTVNGKTQHERTKMHHANVEFWNKMNRMTDLQIFNVYIDS